MHMTPRDDCIEGVRRFNRFYTRRIGVLNEHLLSSSFTLTTARMVYELATNEGVTATELSRRLGLDAGYVSRIVRELEQRGYLERKVSVADARQTHLSLTESGRSAFSELDARSRSEVGAMLDALRPGDQARLLESMERIERLLSGETRGPPSLVVLRSPEPGDLGWVVERHGVLYANEYGWDARFEALVARVVADYVADFDERRDRCWIAERDGERIGSVFVVKETAAVARLRLLLVEPVARGMGLGGRLVEECIRFSRRAGYAKLTLWTNDVLHAARRIYERAGFQRVEQEPHARFGSGLTGETWELRL
jgi:DNA-binding MarR family transcriptional regulator/GNAT superfamily N-acetyltransferase